ncbi:protein of unknown function [Methylorubrum extorquens]|uniref:Uncharacterized protein n=1 Tax=Methylorubrum extorquens TaxID=408 RepID=A0A2N9AQ70_METEX|nr:protein of unknown function [Methylorubrum extorquens]
MSLPVTAVPRGSFPVPFSSRFARVVDCAVSPLLVVRGAVWFSVPLPRAGARGLWRGSTDLVLSP